jgi:hypothetical protein
MPRAIRPYRKEYRSVLESADSEARHWAAAAGRPPPPRPADSILVSILRLPIPQPHAYRLKSRPDMSLEWNGVDVTVRDCQEDEDRDGGGAETTKY